MDERTLDHIGIAVPSLDEALPIWESLLGFPGSGRQVVDSQGAEVVFVGPGPGRVELLAPTRPDSPVARFLGRRGPGMHHLCYRVADLEGALAELTAAGHSPVDPEPRTGAHGHRVVFLHPRTSTGVLIELLEGRA
ncbi:MAG TPA: methylmalonyl-CoA epimerase [Longimicrobiaceae bacterium]|nr:methylmalonyl-CoA epimerase [Longimicrobiaceae bacterium]